MKIWLIILLLTLKTSLSFGRVIIYTFNKQCRKASEIFTGRVIKVTPQKELITGRHSNFRTFEIKFVTNKVWKGQVQDTMTCIASESFCSPNIFETEKEYLVYSENGKITLGSGRSANMQFDLVKAETRKLTMRYLLRRPDKISAHHSFTYTLGVQPITSATRNWRFRS